MRFAINLAHLLTRGCTDANAEKLARIIQQKNRLSEKTPVSFSVIYKWLRKIWNPDPQKCKNSVLKQKHDVKKMSKLFSGSWTFGLLLEREHGVNLVIMREHDWERLKKCDPSVRDFLKDYQAPQSLMPRNGLFGGRTCPARLHYMAAADGSCFYVDFSSLSSPSNSL